MFDRATVSDVLGGLSIVTWLGAQSPQIYENYKNGSVEGLALPFLISWFWGDFTNFVGCVLTHQLPFQTYLATYFLFVDVALVGQYWWFSRQKPPQDLPPLSESFPYAQGPGPNHPPYIHPRKASKSRKRRSRSSRRYASVSTSTAEDPLRASFMSEASARSAPTPNRPPHTRENSSAYPSDSASLHTRTEPPSPTVPERGRTLTRAALVNTFDPTLSTIYGSPAVENPYLGHEDAHEHPHHVSFNPSTESLGNEHEHGHTRRSRGSTSRSRPPTVSRRNTGLAFLSVGLLFTVGNVGGGIGTMSTTQPARSGAGQGTAWSTRTSDRNLDIAATDDSVPSWTNEVRHPAFLPSFSPDVAPRVKRATFPLEVSVSASPISIDLGDVSLFIEDTTRREAGDDDRTPPPPPPGPDWERVIGRASAWLCTTLYLTSRLPQIWRNFRRRSVEGLAMTLFFFAFVGNSLYVASILTNPSASEPGYLQESVPYLLGSGGTLCFDLMIMAQSYLYSDKRKARKEHERRRRAAKGFEGEEEAALLEDDGDDLDHDGAETDGDASTVDGRRRRTHSGHTSRSSSLGYGRSISSRRTNLSMTRTRSSDRVPPSRAERGILEDRPFDFDGLDKPAHGESELWNGRGPRAEPRDDDARWVTRSASRTSSGANSIVEDTIPEEGESAVTIRHDV
ncbi:hypothetical protein JCM10212_001386 [Sporobolomyces blumeae]